MFTGASNLSIDAKGRMAIPTRYRCDALGVNLVLTADPSGCLLLLPLTRGNRSRHASVRCPISTPSRRCSACGSATKVIVRLMAPGAWCSRRKCATTPNRPQGADDWPG